MVKYALSTVAIAVNGVVLSLAFTAVALRIVARKRRSLPMETDDYLIMAALATFTAICSLAIYTAAHDMHATPPWELSEDMKDFLFSSFPAGIIVTYTVYALIKLSILSLYIRIFTEPRFSQIVRDVMGLVCLNTSIGILLQSLAWHPTDETWQRFHLGSYEMVFNHQAFLLSEACFNAFFDIIVFILPLPVISSLHMSHRKRLSLLVVFGLGALCIIVSIIRIYYSIQWLLLNHHEVPIERYGEIITWMVSLVHIEVSCAFIGACLPDMAPLFIGPQGILAPLKFMFSSVASGHRNSTRIRLSDLAASPRERQGGELNNGHDRVDIDQSDTWL